MNATNPPPGRSLAAHLDLLLADAIWAHETRGDLTVLNGLAEAVRDAAGDPELARAATLLHWGAPEDFAEEDLEDDAWAHARFWMAVALATAASAPGQPLDLRADALRWLAELHIEAESAPESVAAYTELVEILAHLSAVDPGKRHTLADELTRLAKLSGWAAESADEADRARFIGDAAAYQLRAAEVHAALVADDPGQVPNLVTASRWAAARVEKADGAEAALAVSAESLRLAELHATELEAPHRLRYVDTAIAEHVGVLMRAGRHDAALRLSHRRLNRYEWPGGVHYDAERHARSLRAHADTLRDVGFPEAALPVLERAIDTALAAEKGEARTVDPMDLAHTYCVELRKRYEERGEAAEALRESERAVAIRARQFDLDPRPKVARAYRDAVESHQTRLSEQDMDDEPVANAHRVIAVFERLDTEGGPNTALAALLCDKLVELDKRGLYAEAAALGDREVAIREDAAEPGPNPDLARAYRNRGLVRNRLGRATEAAEDFARAVERYAVVTEANPSETASVAEALDDQARVLERLHRYDEALAAVERCVALREADPERPAELASAVDLLGDVLHARRDFPAAIAARRRAEAAYAALPESDPERAWNLALVRSNLAATYATAEREHEGLAAGREAAADYEALYAVDPDRARPELARTLRNLCLSLRHAGLLEERVAVAARALALEEEREREDPGSAPLDLADAVDHYSTALGALGRQAEAADLAEHARDLTDRLLETDRVRYLQDAVRLLDNAAMTFSDAGRDEDALALSRKALGFAREFAETDRVNGLRYLGIALLNHGNWLSASELDEEALAIAEECLAVCEAVAAAEPGLHRPLLAKAHVNLGRRLDLLDRRDEAITATDRAIGVLDALAAPDLEVLETLAIAWGNQASNYNATERLDEAEAANRRSADLHERRAALGHRPTVLPDLRNQVSWHACRLANVGRHAEAVERGEYALELCREIGDPEEIAKRQIDLAGLLQDLAIARSEDGDRAGTFNAGQRAIDLVREVYEREPDRDGRELCNALIDWTWALGLVGRYNEQVDAAAEAVAATERHYGDETPVPEDRALALDNLATSLGLAGRYAEALERQRIATAAWESRLAERDTPRRRGELAYSLRFEARWMSETGADPHRIAEVSARAVDLYRDAVAKHPDETADAAVAAGEHAVHLAAIGARDEAVELADEAARTLEALADADRTKRPELAGALRDRARVHAEAGRDDALAIALRSVAVWSALAEELPRAFGFELGLALRLVADLRLSHAPAEAAAFAERAVAQMEAAERWEPGVYAGRLAEVKSTLERCRARMTRTPIPREFEPVERKSKGLMTNPY